MNMSQTLASRSVRLDPRYFVSTVDDQPVTLTADQFRLLYVLMQEPGRVFTRPELIRECKGADYPATPKSVDVAIHMLRQKIGPTLIRTIRGRGYAFAE
jgi:DNA-binding response OmpR family regulator